MRVILFFISLWVGYLACAQEIKPVKVTVEQGIPGESFSKTTLGIEFWIQDKDQLIYLDQKESKVLELKTDSGRNLLEAHQKAVTDYKNYVAEQEKKGRYKFSSRTDQLINFKASTSLRDTLGFKLVLDSWAIPPKNTTSIYCKALVSYFVSDSSANLLSGITKNVVLNAVKTIVFNSKEVPIRQHSSMRTDDEVILGYILNSSELGVLVEKIEQVDDSGKVLKRLSNSSGKSSISFEVNENEISSPMNLKFTYKPLRTKSIAIDQQLRLGL